MVEWLGKYRKGYKNKAKNKINFTGVKKVYIFNRLIDVCPVLIG